MKRAATSPSPPRSGGEEELPRSPPSKKHKPIIPDEEEVSAGQLLPEEYDVKVTCPECEREEWESCMTYCHFCEQKKCLECTPDSNNPPYCIDCEENMHKSTGYNTQFEDEEEP